MGGEGSGKGVYKEGGIDTQMELVRGMNVWMKEEGTVSFPDPPSKRSGEYI